MQITKRIILLGLVTSILQGLLFAVLYDLINSAYRTSHPGSYRSDVGWGIAMQIIFWTYCILLLFVNTAVAMKRNNNRLFLICGVPIALFTVFLLTYISDRPYRVALLLVLANGLLLITILSDWLLTKKRMGEEGSQKRGQRITYRPLQLIIGLFITSLGLGTVLSSCNPTQSSKDSILATDTLNQVNVDQRTLPDTMAGLFSIALTSDSVESKNDLGDGSHKSFLFFKSGGMFSKKEKNALTVVCPTDTTYKVCLYSIHAGEWTLLDTMDGLEAFPFQFEAVFDDYNFDSQTDLYIQITASQGWSLSRGHLITLDPDSKKFNLHTETRDMANMEPDPKTKTVKTELWNGYDTNGHHQITVFTNKWRNGKLEMISKKNMLPHLEH